jgi:hypothetical protein
MVNIIAHIAGGVVHVIGTGDALLASRRHHELRGREK